MATPLIVERTYNAPIQKVWDAITQKDQMKEWYFELDAFKAEKGFKFEFTGGDENVQYLHACEVLESNPPHKLVYSWTYPEYSGYSVLTWELFSIDEQTTTLRLTHEGLETFPQEDPNFRIESFTGGWNYFVNEALPAYVETEMIEKSVEIYATAENIWDVLMHPAGQWANAFSEGTIVKTDWKPGSAVIWTDASGDIGAYGVVTAHTLLEYLQVDMYDTTSPAPDEVTGEYKEKYKLVPEGDHYRLHVTAGPLTKKHIPEHGKMWDEALKLLKAYAEEK